MIRNHCIVCIKLNVNGTVILMRCTLQYY